MALLYELSDDPEEALAEIREHYAPPDGSDKKKLRGLLFDDVRNVLTADDYVRSKVIENIAKAHALTGEDEPEIRGPLGLYLGLSAAVDFALAVEPHGALPEKTVELFRDAAALECFRTFYEIEPLYDLAGAKLHRIGTTSLILRCPVHEDRDHPRMPPVVALKCLLPRYHRVRVIRERTDKYVQEHSLEVPSTAKIFASGHLTITMEFIEGETLAERLRRRAVSKELPKREQVRERALHDADITFIREVGLAICECLRELRENGHHHLDLAPSNIIVVSKEREPLKVRLIDLGRNFAISERVGTSAAYERAALYVAPELLQDNLIDSWRCDAYSLGIILLETAAKRELTKEDLAAELGRLWQGERPWEGAPEIARIVDELVDENPVRRLTLADETDDPYHYLQKLIYQETEVLELYEDQTEGSGFGLLRGLDLIKIYKRTQPMNLVKAGKEIEEPVDGTYEDFPALARWALLAMLCWVLTLSSFLALTAADLGLTTLKPWVEQLAELTHARFEVGPSHFWHNLPGRLVALSFGLTAVTYYINNFATLSPKRLEVRIGQISEVLMRSSAVVLVIPIMIAMVYNPDAWPLCAGFGTLLVVLNNFVSLRIAGHAYDTRRQRRFTPQDDAGYRFINDVFTEWWLLMGWYSISLIAIGILLLEGEASDAGVFAILVIVANVVKMYRTNCVQTAPQVRGCLSRAMLTLRRANRLGLSGQTLQRAESPRWWRRSRLRNWLWAST
ncbi:MAG TPA: protein kinase [Solirubrobacterales bacterium]